MKIQAMESDIRNTALFATGQWRTHLRGVLARLRDPRPQRKPVRVIMPIIEEEPPLVVISSEDQAPYPAAEYVPPSYPTIRKIQRVICDRFDITHVQLVGDQRIKPLVQYRQFAMVCCKRLTPFSYPMIGKFFGGRDHTTVLHAINKITPRLEAHGASNKTTLDEMIGLVIEHPEIIFVPPARKKCPTT